MQELKLCILLHTNQAKFKGIDQPLNLPTFKQTFVEIATTCSGTKRKVDTFRKNVQIVSHVGLQAYVCQPIMDISVGQNDIHLDEVLGWKASELVTEGCIGLQNAGGIPFTQQNRND